LKSSLIECDAYEEKIEDVDNIFTSATENDINKHVTLSAFSRPEKYYQSNIKAASLYPSTDLMQLINQRRDLRKKSECSTATNKIYMKNLKELNSLKDLLTKDDVKISVSTIEKAIDLPDYIREGSFSQNHRYTCLLINRNTSFEYISRICEHPNLQVNPFPPPPVKKKQRKR